MLRSRNWSRRWDSACADLSPLPTSGRRGPHRGHGAPTLVRRYGHGMASAPDAPRLTPLTADDVTEEQRELLQSVATSDDWAINIFATLVRHPGLFRRWLPFGGKLLAGKLPARERELLILRTGWLCRSEYEWGQHVVIGRGAGV